MGSSADVQRQNSLEERDLGEASLRATKLAKAILWYTHRYRNCYFLQSEHLLVPLVSPVFITKTDAVRIIEALVFVGENVLI